MNKPEPTTLSYLYDQLDEVQGQLDYAIRYRQAIADGLAPGQLKAICEKRLRYLREADIAIDRAREMLTDAMTYDQY